VKRLWGLVGIPEPADQKVPDLLNRDVTAQAPNQRYVGDITYLPLADGNDLYLATAIDCYSRQQLLESACPRTRVRARNPLVDARGQSRPVVRVCFQAASFSAKGLFQS
jgi:transposase InsO family protein